MSFETFRRRQMPIDAPGSTYPGFAPRRELLRAGAVVHGGRPLSADIQVDRDVAIELRDGITVYADVFSPPDRTDDLPAIVVWSPYGKHDYGFLLDTLPNRGGFAVDAFSNLQKFEGPDPDVWCGFGYVIVNVDARGVYASEGEHVFWSVSEGRDAHDVIEWCAAQPWSNGRVAMSGNSWYAVSQWFAAAERPPHLTAIAPWEGMSDYYRNMAIRGGIPTGDEFVDFILTNFIRGNGTHEDISKMMDANPFYNEYWDSKRADVERITAPAYVVASWTQLHSSGTLDAYRRLHSDKWLRIHNTHEWPDYYDPTYVADLRRFFDHFLLDVDNGWETTPRVRHSILDPGGIDVVDKPENAFPPRQYRHRKLHLHPQTRSLQEQSVQDPTEVTYTAVGAEIAFTYTFDQDTDLVGYSTLRMWVEARGSQDMDLFVRLDKLGTDGSLLSPIALGNPVQGSSGQLRVSHRALDPVRSTLSEPFHTHDGEDLLHPGEIVPVDLGIWATGLRFHAGERLKLTISGDRIIPAELNMPSKRPLRNEGTHVIHVGGGRESYLLVPLAHP